MTPLNLNSVPDYSSLAIVDLGTFGLVTLVAMLTIVVGVAAGGLIHGLLTPHHGRRADNSDANESWNEPGNIDQCAIVIATKNGADTLAATIGHAVANQVPVYVLSDGGHDATVAVSRAAGAEVVEYAGSRGKPSTLYAGCADLDLLAHYRFLTIIDDDTHLEPDFVERSLEYFDADTAVVVGRTETLWPPSLRWNALVAYRAFARWLHQLPIRTPQSWLSALTYMSGSNATYRTDVLRDVIVKTSPAAVKTTPDVVDDTHWLLETHRQNPGRIRCGPAAWAWIRDPTDIKDFYQRNLRWLWSTNQGIVDHRIGHGLLQGQPSAVEVLQTVLIARWVAYLIGLPVLVFLAATQGFVIILYLVLARWIFFSVLLALASIQLRHAHLVLFAPALIVLDLLFRLISIHAVVKTVRQPTSRFAKSTNSPVRPASQ